MGEISRERDEKSIEEFETWKEKYYN